MAALTVSLVIFMRTRWGHEQPLRKCVVLSLFAHLLFIAYATTVHIVRMHPGHGRGHGTAIRITDLVGYDTVDAQGVASTGKTGADKPRRGMLPRNRRRWIRNWPTRRSMNR